MFRREGWSVLLFAVWWCAEIIWRFYLSCLCVSRFLVGAPKEKALFLKNVNETGAVYTCPMTADPNDCTRMDLVGSGKQLFGFLLCSYLVWSFKKKTRFFLAWFFLRLGFIPLQLLTTRMPHLYSCSIPSVITNVVKTKVHVSFWAACVTSVMFLQSSHAGCCTHSLQL